MPSTDVKSEPPIREMREWLACTFPAAAQGDAASVENMPGGGDAYLLALHLAGPVQVAIRGAKFDLGAGWYAYAGSAHGPGGIRARLARHFRREKRPHWHIDQLSGAADAAFALALPDGSECAIVARLESVNAARFPTNGFGSSDCRRCRSHLLALGPPS